MENLIFGAFLAKVPMTMLIDLNLILSALVKVMESTFNHLMYDIIIDVEVSRLAVVCL